MALRTSAAELTTTSSRDDAAELAATTSSSRDDAEAAAAKATLDLLRVADAINADGDADASCAAADACGRLERALVVPGAVRPQDAPAALLPAALLLLRPPRGRRRRAAVEAIASCASAAIHACGPALARVAGADGVARLLGGVGLRLADAEEGVASREEATLALLGAARSAFASSSSAKGADRKAWLQVWARLDGQGSDGRVLVAGLAHAAAQLVTHGSGRATRRAAVELLDAMVASTPVTFRQDLWRCFLPGLFGPLWAAAAAPPTPREADGLRALALAACTRLVVVVCGGPVKDALHREQVGPRDAGVRVAPTLRWRETTRDRLLFHVPAMLVACRRDAAPTSRRACVEAAAVFRDECAAFLGPCAALSDTLAALCFDDDPVVAALARRASVETSSPGQVAKAAQAAATIACAGDEAALRDALDLASGRCIGTRATDWDGDAAFHTLDGLACALAGVGNEAATCQALDAPLGAPRGLVAHDTFEKRMKTAGRCGAAYPRPRKAHLHAPATRDALCRVVWLLATKAPTLSLEACLRGLNGHKHRAAWAFLLSDLVNALAAAPRLDDAVADEPVDVTKDQRPLEKAAELVALAEYVADEALASTAWFAVDAEDDVVEASPHLLRDGTSMEAAPAPETLLDEGAAPELCRALAACAGLAAARGGAEALAPLLRRALYPLLEKLASKNADARQASLAALVECAACTQTQDPRHALAELLAANLDYVVDAACRRLRRAATPYEAAQSASVVEVLLRHSRAEPATPLLRDVVRNALRDVDAHCVSAGSGVVAASFLRLMRAMVRAMPHVAGEETLAMTDDAVDWLKPLLRDFGDAEARRAAQDDAHARFRRALDDYGPRDPPPEDAPPQPVKRDASGLTDEEKVFMGNRNHHAQLKDMAPADATAEEILLSDVAKRATYFVATDDLGVQTVAFGVLADAADRLRAVPDRVRPLVHACWPSIRARLPTTREACDDVYRASGEHQRCTIAALDVVAVLAFCVGDFVAFKFRDDAWPSLQLLLKPPLLEDGDAVAQRDGVLVAALNCCARLAQRRDLDELIGPVADGMCGLALALAPDGASPNVCAAVTACVTALIRHDGDAVWFRVCDGSGAPPLPSCAPLPSCTSRKLAPDVRVALRKALDRIDVELPDGGRFWL